MEIAKIIFHMEGMMSQVHGASVFNFTTIQFERYSNLAREKAEKLAKLREFMVNDHDI
jgi:hypothetical protein